MRLFIAEKPSMGREIAKCLPTPHRSKDGYIETGGGIVTWGFGHILRQAEPNEYDEKYRRWNMSDLPIIPSEWKMLVIDSCEKQFHIVKNLIEQADELVHAGDPDREGQLLIDEIFDYLEVKDKPIRRLLLNALDTVSIQTALGSLKENHDFLCLKQSALARSRADWLIGMNLSRAYTIAARRMGHQVTLPIGRVKTPTLALVVRRENEIKNFVPVDYYILKADFAFNDEVFTTQWKPADTQKGLDSEDRMIDLDTAHEILARMTEDRNPEIPGNVTKCERALKKEAQRLPYSLSALQIEAGKRYKYDPQLVLDTAQKLYEKKLTTYPRSDCDYLPEVQKDAASIITRNLSQSGNEKLALWSERADLTIKSRAWNDKKITAHHAIIPTQVKCDLSTLSDVERNIYFLIAQAYLAQFYPIHTYQQTKLEIVYRDECFTASGRIIKQMGWKALYAADKSDKKDEVSVLPPVVQGSEVDFRSARLEKKTTRPPTRFTAATLLAAMKEIHRYVKNQDLKKKLKDVCGIGTEATRATMINELLIRGFLKEEKKFLVPTPNAYLMIEALPDEMTYPDATAIWENALHSMKEGKSDLDSFLETQIKFMTELCQKAETTQIPTGQDTYRCPQCKQGILKKRTGRNGDFWGCSRYPSCNLTLEDDGGRPKKTGFLCKKCKVGILRLIRGKNGAFWGCSNYPTCNATYNDENGRPVLSRY
ncbi:MAG: DNA topoisomerase 3 [Selenomonadales bacterium]|nr:DNA topoisomerase 3 [Selenomonadales bacterium]